MAVNVKDNFHHALKTVCDVFKIPSLYSEQEKCLEALFKRKGCVCKSSNWVWKVIDILCSPVAELFSRTRGYSKIIVISPLKTLMEDQVSFLWSLGLTAFALHDEQSEERLKEVEKGAFTYLFASREKMLSME